MVDTLTVWLLPMVWAVAEPARANRPRPQAALSSRRCRRLACAVLGRPAAPIVKPLKIIAKTAPEGVALHALCRECIAGFSSPTNHIPQGRAPKQIAANCANYGTFMKGGPGCLFAQNVDDDIMLAPEPAEPQRNIGQASAEPAAL